MILHTLTPELSIQLASKMFAFEALFDYPLGEHQRFRIEHGPNYTAFYASIGEAISWVLEKNSRIVACLSVSIRQWQDSKGILYRIAYLGDLKIHPEERSGRVLYEMVRRIQPILESRVDMAYGIVMEGTTVTPIQYTGRLAIPAFQPGIRLYILRLEFDHCLHSLPQANTLLVSAERGTNVYQSIVRAPCALSHHSLRSSFPVQWLTVDSTACGMIEDTRLAKRLYLTTGDELLSAHLSYFAFTDVQAAIQVLQAACTIAEQHHYSALFVGVRVEQYAVLARFLDNIPHTIAPAQIFATHTLPQTFTINTSEI